MARAPRYDRDQVGAYVEYGVSERLMLVARPALDWIRTGFPDQGRYAGLGGATLGAQWQALAFDGAVVAVQGSLAVPGSTARANPALVGNTVGHAEPRLLAGWSLPGPLQPFVEVEAAYRVRFGGAPAERHLDLTAGLRPVEDVLLLAQVFATAYDAAGAARDARWTARLDLKAVRFLTPTWAVEAGAFQTVAGRDSLRERGLTAGIWHLF